MEEFELRQKAEFAKSIAQKAQVEILTWVMKLCGSGMTPAMVRKMIHNKIVELEGKGEKA